MLAMIVWSLSQGIPALNWSVVGSVFGAGLQEEWTHRRQMDLKPLVVYHHWPLKFPF